MKPNQPASQQALFQADVTPEKSLRDQNIEIMLKEAYSKKNLEMKTDLNARQITNLAIGKVFVKRFKSRMMSTLISEFMALSVSKGRQGRKEWVEMSKAFHQEQENQESGLIKNLLGK